MFHITKKGPGITQSDLLIVNKTDLAPIIGADLDVMARDAKKMRYEYTSCRRIMDTHFSCCLTEAMALQFSLKSRMALLWMRSSLLSWANGALVVPPRNLLEFLWPRGLTINNNK